MIRWLPERDGPSSESVLRRRLEHLGYSVTRYVYPPGTYFPDHHHETDKMDAVVSGRLRITMDGKEYILEAGDMIAVPRAVTHSAEVIGDKPVISLDGVRE